MECRASYVGGGCYVGLTRSVRDSVLGQEQEIGKVPGIDRP